MSDASPSVATFGEREWAENHKYYGQLFQDNYHNHGIYYDEDGGFFYAGKFYVNKLEGYCKVIHKNGIVFTGLFKNHKRCGPGIEEHNNETENVGFWDGMTLMRLSKTVGGVPCFFHNYTKMQNDISNERDEPNLAEEILENLGADSELVEKYSNELYNLKVRNENNRFFNHKVFNRVFQEYYPENKTVFKQHLERLERILEKLQKDKDRLEKKALAKLEMEKWLYEQENIDQSKRQTSTDESIPIFLNFQSSETELPLQDGDVEEEKEIKEVVYEINETIEELIKNAQEHEEKEQMTLIYQQQKSEQASTLNLEDSPKFHLAVENPSNKPKSSTPQQYSKVEADTQSMPLQLGEQISLIFSQLIPPTHQMTAVESLRSLVKPPDDTGIIEKAPSMTAKSEPEPKPEKEFILVKSRAQINVEEKIFFFEAIKETLINKLKKVRISVANAISITNLKAESSIKELLVHFCGVRIPNIHNENVLWGTRIEKPSGAYETNCIQFLEYCYKGDSLKDIFRLLKNNINPDLCDGRGNTGIFFATANNQIVVIDTLINCGAKTDVVNDEGVTCLILCVLKYLAILKGVHNWRKGFLEEPEPNIDGVVIIDEDFEEMSLEDDQNCVLICDPQFYCPNLELHPEEILKVKRTICTLLQYSGDLNAGNFPHPLLPLSIFTEDFDLIKDFLDKGADPNALTKSYLSALHIVASLPPTQNSLKMFRMLLNYGCNPNAKTPKNHWEEYGQHINKSIKDSKNVLHMLCLRHDSDPENVFVAMASALKDYDFNFGEYYLGHTPLALAVRHMNLPIIQCLGKVVDIHQPLLNNMGNALTIFLTKGVGKLDFDKCKTAIDELIKLGANPLHPFGEYDNVVDYIKGGAKTDKNKRTKDKKKKKGKGKEAKSSKVSSRSSKSSSASSKKNKASRTTGKKSGKKGRNAIVLVKSYLEKLAKETLLVHMKSKIVKTLYLAQLAGVSDPVIEMQSKYLKPSDILDHLQVHFQSGDLNKKFLNREKIIQSILVVNLNEDEKTWLNAIEKTNFKRKARSKFNKFDPNIDKDVEKYKICMNCLQKRKQLFLCPKCKIAWFCSEKCNKLSNKKKEHKCQINFYKTAKQEFNKIEKQKLKEKKKQHSDKKERGKQSKNKKGQNLNKKTKLGESQAISLETESENQQTNEVKKQDEKGMDDYETQLTILIEMIEKKEGKDRSKKQESFHIKERTKSQTTKHKETSASTSNKGSVINDSPLTTRKSNNSNSVKNNTPVSGRSFVIDEKYRTKTQSEKRTIASASTDSTKRNKMYSSINKENRNEKIKPESKTNDKLRKKEKFKESPREFSTKEGKQLVKDLYKARKYVDKTSKTSTEKSKQNVEKIQQRKMYKRDRVDTQGHKDLESSGSNERKDYKSIQVPDMLSLMQKVGLKKKKDKRAQIKQPTHKSPDKKMLQELPKLTPHNMTKIVHQIIAFAAKSSDDLSKLKWLKMIFPDFNIPLLFLPEAHLHNGQMSYSIKAPNKQVNS